MASLFNSSYSEKIIVKPSRIVNSNTIDELNTNTECCTLPVGNGLFSKKNITRGDVICLYSGILIDELEARYTDPTYTVEFEYGRGLKLLGSSGGITAGNIDSKGFLGHVANSAHPLHEFPKQNARFDLKNKFSTRRLDNKINKSLFVVGDVGYFPIVACRDIAAGEEIIVDYGQRYWTALAEWISKPKEKTQKIIERDNRKRKRDEAKQIC